MCLAQLPSLTWHLTRVPSLTWHVCLAQLPLLMNNSFQVWPLTLRLLFSKWAPNSLLVPAKICNREKMKDIRLITKSLKFVPDNNSSFKEVQLFYTDLPSHISWGYLSSFSQFGLFPLQIWIGACSQGGTYTRQCSGQHHQMKHLESRHWSLPPEGSKREEGRGWESGSKIIGTFQRTQVRSHVRLFGPVISVVALLDYYVSAKFS